MSVSIKIKDSAGKIALRRLEIFSLSADLVEAVKRIEIESALSEWTQEDYRAESERADSIALVAALDKKVVGFIVARLIMSEIDSSLQALQKTAPETDSHKIVEAEIYNLAVSKNFRNKKIGQALLDRFLELAEKKFVSKIWLEVRASNREALEFYQKNEFREIYRRKNFYRAPSEDASVLCLDLWTEK